MAATGVPGTTSSPYTPETSAHPDENTLRQFGAPFAPFRGKIERLNRVVEGFLSEVALENPKTLEQLNDLTLAKISPSHIVEFED